MSKTMRVKVHGAYRSAGYPRDGALDPNKTYEAIIASNQPDYENLGLVFVGEILLDRTEYTVI